jgi:hypothetical protein
MTPLEAILVPAVVALAFIVIMEIIRRSGS